MTDVSILTDGIDLSPIEQCLNRWHSVLTGERGALEALIADDAVFRSPIVYTPQRGKDLVLMYLTGASMTFGGDGTSGTVAPPGAGTPREPVTTDPDGNPWDGRFRYVRKVTGTHDAVLEFETTMQGTYVNGVDMIRCDDSGTIVDFTVMIRPLQAVDAVHRAMGATLERMKARGGS
ncbi:MAG: nuclear transport factor 2 family protein [Actinomycetota bacterium]|jgi:hypothetical protein|nr:nuclear transport factor 2 family protein [Actinomycetota bacterium]